MTAYQWVKLHTSETDALDDSWRNRMRATIKQYKLRLSRRMRTCCDLMATCANRYAPSQCGQRRWYHDVLLLLLMVRREAVCRSDDSWHCIAMILFFQNVIVEISFHNSEMWRHCAYNEHLTLHCPHWWRQAWSHDTKCHIRKLTAINRTGKKPKLHTFNVDATIHVKWSRINMFLDCSLNVPDRKTYDTAIDWPWKYWNKCIDKEASGKQK